MKLLLPLKLHIWFEFVLTLNQVPMTLLWAWLVQDVTLSIKLFKKLPAKVSDMPHFILSGEVPSGLDFLFLYVILVILTDMIGAW